MHETASTSSSCYKRIAYTNKFVCKNASKLSLIDPKPMSETVLIVMNDSVTLCKRSGMYKSSIILPS